MGDVAVSCAAIAAVGGNFVQMGVPAAVRLA
jgi:hypothetical protein